GKHRSVATAEELAKRLRAQGIQTLVLHRDLGRE
ncbi:MAG: RNase adaptor protein RapZ, partial [Actinobacteria bacterium]|nr:RNase adaptor protein RapZ [Actinomycetota bacterium]